MDPSEDIINNQQKSFIDDINENTSRAPSRINSMVPKTTRIASESQLIDLLDGELMPVSNSKEKSLLSLTGNSMTENSDNNISN